MIVRVLNVRIAKGRGPEFHAFMRERGLPRMQLHPGLVSVNVGRRTDGPDEFAVIVTVWRDWDALHDALGPDPWRPYMVTEESGLAETARVEHFEAIELPDLGQLAAGAAAPEAQVAEPAPST
jgi:hypothetical protein